MTDISTTNLINQMRTLQAQAEGSALEVNPHQTQFGTYLQNALAGVDQSNQTAENLRTRFELGDPNVSLADAMIATQKANIGFEATLQFRNKIIKAYEDMMGMPI